MHFMAIRCSRSKLLLSREVLSDTAKIRLAKQLPVPTVNSSSAYPVGSFPFLDSAFHYSPTFPLLSDLRLYGSAFPILTLSAYTARPDQYISHPILYSLIVPSPPSATTTAHPLRSHPSNPLQPESSRPFSS